MRHDADPDATLPLQTDGGAEQYTLLNDLPVERPDGDLLGMQVAAAGIADMLRTSAGRSPFTVGVDAGWGMGKSTLLRQVKAELEKPRGQREPGFKTVWFNAWTAEGSDALAGLIKLVLQELDPNIVRRALRSLTRRKHMLGVAGVIVAAAAQFFGITRLVDELWKQFCVDEPARNKIRDDIGGMLAEWVGSDPERPARCMVVFIDDLDRCSDDIVVQVCEAVKLYLDVPGLIFVLACDQSVLARGVQDPARGGIDEGRSYLEKIVQVQYRLPPPDDTAIERLIDGYAKASNTRDLIKDEVRTTLAEGCGRNPRKIKRIINSFILESRLNPAWQDPPLTSRHLLTAILLQHLYAPFYDILIRDRPGSDPIGTFLAYAKVRSIVRNRPHDGVLDSAEVTEFLREHEVLIPEHGADDPERVVSLLDVNLPEQFPVLASDARLLALLRSISEESRKNFLRLLFLQPLVTKSPRMQAPTARRIGEWSHAEEEVQLLAGKWFASQADEEIQSAGEWSLSGDLEGKRHWLPRARGVNIDSERGYRFRGRTRALEVIRDWLDRAEADRRVLVVTGSPGAGKSAVLGRIVTTADANAAVRLPGSDMGVRATIGSVSCAVHAKGKSSLDVATEVSRAASAVLPGSVEDFAPSLRNALVGQGRRFNVIIDALDEAATPEQARAIVTKVILPAVETCADVGAQVVVGSRRADGEGALMAVFGTAVQVVDLDDPAFSAAEDLVAYALATLQLAGDERPGNPYNDDAVAAPVAARIAELSGRNFLVAGLTARSHGMHDDVAADPATLSFAAAVEDVLREYLSFVQVPAMAADSAPSMTAATLLTALAFAEAPGLPTGLWRTALRALAVGDVSEAALTGFARSSAASFLVESSEGNGQGSESAFRLFHQALNDALLHARARVAELEDDQQALVQAFLAAGRDEGWERAPGYLLRSLPGHAAAGGVIGELLADDGYLLHADLRRVQQTTVRTLSPAEREQFRLLSLTPEAMDAGPADRAAMLSVTEALEGIGTAYRESRQPAPYRARWAVAHRSSENRILHGPDGAAYAMCAVKAGNRTLLATGGHGAMRLWDPATGDLARVLDGQDGAVLAMCAVEVGGRTLLAAATAAAGGDHSTVWLWDPVTGATERILRGHDGYAEAVCTVAAGDWTLLATGSSDRMVRLWDPLTGDQVRILEGHGDIVNAMCAVEAGGRTLLATGSRDGTIRLWDPRSGEQLRVMEGHRGGVHAVCAVGAGGRTLLAASDDGAVRLWDPLTGEQVRLLDGHDDSAGAVCAVEAGERTLLAAATFNRGRGVRLWDPVTGDQARVLDGHGGEVHMVCAVEAGGRTLLAASNDQAVRLWDPLTGTQERDDRRGTVLAVCGVEAGGRTLLAAATAAATVGRASGRHGVVRLWDPVTGNQERVLDGLDDSVGAVCSLEADGRILLATVAATAAGDRGVVRLWDPLTGDQVRILKGHGGGVNAVCAVETGDRTLLATGGSGGVRLWDPATGVEERALDGDNGAVLAVCTVKAGSRTLLAAVTATIGKSDHRVRLWDPVTGGQVRVLVGLGGKVRSACAVDADGRSLLATGDDGVVRLWDPVTGAEERVLEGHDGDVNAVCAVEVEGRILLATGSSDRTVRLWDPVTGRCELTLPVHHGVLAIAPAGAELAVGLTTGVLVLTINAVTIKSKLRA